MRFLILGFFIFEVGYLGAVSEVDFYEAIKKGDSSKVLKMVTEKRELLQTKDALGRNPALVAVIYQKEDLALELIKMDTNLAYGLDRSGEQIFLYACEFGHSRLVDYLTSTYIIRPDSVTNEHDENCLMLAKKKGHYEIAHNMEKWGLKFKEYNQLGVTVAYVVYVIISLITTVWVARTLHKNGRIFLVDSLKKEDLADSVNHLLVVGFYLVNFGFIAFALKIANKPKTTVESIEILSQKIGLVLVVLGVMHFFNLYMFGRLKKKTTQYEAN